jgi:hypothetical protein
MNLGIDYFCWTTINYYISWIIRHSLAFAFNSVKRPALLLAVAFLPLLTKLSR